MKRVVIGYFGSQLDAGGSARRWQKWRPSVDLCRHEDFLVDRFELLHGKRDAHAAQRVAEDIAQVSPETEVRVRELSFRDPWDFEEVFAAFLDASRAYPFQEDEEYLIHITTGTHVMQICAFLLTESRHLPGKLLQASPPPKQRKGEPGKVQIIDLDRQRYDALARRFGEERRDDVAFLKDGVETRNARFNTMIDAIERVAIRSPEPILLTGPTGAGKTQLARRIHALRRSRSLVSGELVEVNCATLRGDHAMSALFGHVRGAFTGAEKARQGLLRRADGGAIFLDEIGDLGLDEQAMLLRAIEEKRFLPVGGDKEVSAEFRLVAGTNVDLAQAVHEGRFREDLYARIRLWHFDLPGLRERREDLEPNLDAELRRAEARVGVRATMNGEAREAFLKFATGPEGAWPGNFRDLNAAVVRMATLAPGGRIDERTVADEVARLRSEWRPMHAGGGGAGGSRVAAVLGDAELDRFDRAQLEEVLRVCERAPTLSAAGRELFAVSRQERKSKNDADRLRKYLGRFGLSFGEVQGALR